MGSEPPFLRDYEQNIRTKHHDSSTQNGGSVDDVMRPLVSVITVCRNSERTIQRTIESVLSQSYKRIEYIIIDGLSTDNTMSIIKKYDYFIKVVVSEADCGISDAFNKGLARSSGSIVMILNSDDWISANFLETAVQSLVESDREFVFGDLEIFDLSGKLVGIYKGDKNYKNVILHRMPAINHPTVVCRKVVYENCGLFNTNLHYAMDYEWLCRITKSGYAGLYVQKLIGKMTLDGRSDLGFSRSLAEVRDISIAYGYSLAAAHCRYVFRVIKGYVRRRLEEFAPRVVVNWIRLRLNRDYFPKG